MNGERRQCMKKKGNNSLSSCPSLISRSARARAHGCCSVHLRASREGRVGAIDWVHSPNPRKRGEEGTSADDPPPHPSLSHFHLSSSRSHPLTRDLVKEADPSLPSLFFSCQKGLIGSCRASQGSWGQWTGPRSEDIPLLYVHARARAL